MKTMNVDGWPIEYVESGPEDGRPLILLSGWAQDHRLFRSLEPLLAEDFHVYRQNYRGHDGLLTQNGDFTSDDMIEDTLAFIEHNELARPHIVSTSHGCWINIGVQDRLGNLGLGKAVVIDWLMQPFDAFHKQIEEGIDPATYASARRSMFDEWTSTTQNLDVIDHVNREMTWFGGEMWMRACREIKQSYAKWGDPLARMSALDPKCDVMHIYSQPLSDSYRIFQEEYAEMNGWFQPHHIPGETHFPTLENPNGVAEAIVNFFD